MAMPDVVSAFFTSGRVVDVALVFIAIEYALLLARAKNGDRFARLKTLSHALGPGVCLMLALRCALAGASPLWIGFWLTASLPLHMWDIASRKL
jgi:hypothetical protein